MAKRRIVDVDSDEFEAHEEDLRHKDLMSQLTGIAKLLSEANNSLKSNDNEKIIANIDTGITRLENALKSNASNDASQKILAAIQKSIDKLYDRMSQKRDWNFTVTRDDKGLIKSVTAKEV